MAIQSLDPIIASNLAASGSEVATTRPALPFQASAKDAGSGFIYSPQTQQSYDASAIKQVIDTNVGELVGPTEEQTLDLVPRPLYEDALDALASAEQIIETQSQTIAELESKITELQSQIESLSSDLDNEKLLRVVAEANADNLRQQLQLINESSQVALQRSVLEGIQRSNLEAKSEGLRAEVQALKDRAIGLQQQIDSLNNTLAGKDAQIAAGALTNAQFSARVVNKGAPGDNELVLDCSITDANSGNGAQWINGPDIEIYNNDPGGNDQTITIDVSQCIADNQVWARVDTSTFTVRLNETVRFRVMPDYPALDRVYPRTRFGTSARSYANGKIIIRSSINNAQLALSARVYKHKDG